MATPTLVKVRHLTSVGVLQDIGVDAFPHEFRKFNVIYGFNGSGKSTLCRLIESVSEAGLNANLPEKADFSFRMSDGTTPTNVAPANAASRHIAVFSEDFVARSLTWQSGAAEPIIFIGEEQAELAKALEKLEADENGLAPQQSQRAGEWSASTRALETHCRQTARSIAEEMGLGRRYTAPTLKADYADASLNPADKCSEKQRAALKEVIWRTDAPQKAPILTFPACAATLQEAVTSAVAISVQEITDKALQRRKDALPWIERGLELHTNEHHCLFCGHPFHEERRTALLEALSGGFDELTEKLRKVATSISLFRDECAELDLHLQTLPEVAPEFRADLKDKRDLLRGLLSEAQLAGKEWEFLLQQKAQDPAFAEQVKKNLSGSEWDSRLGNLLKEANHLISAHNGYVDNFEAERTAAATKLRRHFLADTLSAYQALVNEEATGKAALGDVDASLARLREQIKVTKSQLKVHGPAAKKLNSLLQSYLGHGKITLAANDVGYEICRDGKPSTKPLSEGEKTAVAFCYFVTSLTAEGRKMEDMIVVIDDPISSLDTRAMSHVVGMIRLRFAKAAQFFILTHNLDFMREMKKWLGRARDKGDAAFFFIETRLDDGQGRSSTIVEMPALIREYESEYHYLFSLACMLVVEPAKAGGFLYLMPNALRKVLETFLAFKQPGYSDLEGLEKILELHPAIDPDRVKAMELLVQSESHSQNIGDSVSFSAYTLEQVTDAGRTLLSLIEAADKPHYDRMRKLCKL